MKTLKMTLFSTILSLLTSPMAYADQATEVKEARSNAFTALQSYKQVQDLQKRMLQKSSNTAGKAVPVDPKKLQIAGALAVSAATGKVSTKPLNLNRKIAGVTVSPLVEYDFKEKSRGSLNFVYSF